MGIPIMKMDKLLKAFNNSTPSNNLFELEVRRIKWDNIFTEDGEMYFQLEDITLVTTSLNPFKVKKDNDTCFLIPGEGMFRFHEHPYFI